MFNKLSLGISIALIASPAIGGEMIDAGSPFPSFSLTAHDGSTVSSEALEGTPYLVYFYPKADTQVCTKQACSIRDARK